LASQRSKPAPQVSAFISHAKADAKKAQAIAEGLEKRGFKCWIAPRDVKAGRSYGDEIIRGIEGARSFVLVLSKASNDSAFVAREVERAVSKKKPIFAVRIADIEPAPSLELFVSSTQWIDAFKGRLGPHIDRLADLLTEEEGVEPVKPEPDKEKPGPSKMPKWAWPAGAAAAVLLAGAIGIFVWQWEQSDSSRERLQTDYYACANLAIDLATPACDRAIASGNFTGEELAGLYSERGNLRMQKGELDKALADLDESIRINPASFIAFWTRGAVYVAKNDFERAREDFNRALALNPDDASKTKIKEVLNAVTAGIESAVKSQPSDKSVITEPVWNSPGEVAGSAASSSPADVTPAAPLGGGPMPAIPAAPPMPVTPAIPTVPQPMPVR
jgi:hypothetical protein